MSKILAILKGDLKNITRDTMLFFILVSPFFIGIAFKILIPWVTIMLKQNLDFNLVDHYHFIMAFIIMLIPLMLGMMIGFVILEDRDQGILSYFAVTPLSKFNYLAYRLIISIVVSFIFSLFIIYFLRIIEIKIFMFIPIIFIASMEAPIMSIFIAAFADNKVEGFAFSKGAGILFAAPLAGYLLKTRWSILIGIFPTYWVSEAFLAVYKGLSYYFFNIAGGIIIHFIFIILLLNKYKTRIS